MIFTENTDFLKHPFNLNDEIVETVHHIKDFGSVFDSKFFSLLMLMKLLLSPLKR